ncbi:hypothetical protein [Kiloniella sp.]|uniref:hypothetical protein n=1 Tax=Kiloniella sp. TaxID=1938587 RepID=UPI003B02544D
MQKNTYQSSLIETDQLPEDLSRLLKIWNDQKPADGFPLKNEMDPVDYKDFLGRICIIEIQQDPLFSDNNLGRLRQPPWPVDLIIKKGVPV